MIFAVFISPMDMVSVFYLIVHTADWRTGKGESCTRNPYLISATISKSYKSPDDCGYLIHQTRKEKQTIVVSK